MKTGLYSREVGMPRGQEFKKPEFRSCRSSGGAGPRGKRIPRFSHSIQAAYPVVPGRTPLPSEFLLFLKQPRQYPQVLHIFLKIFVLWSLENLRDRIKLFRPHDLQKRRQPDFTFSNVFMTVYA